MELEETIERLKKDVKKPLACKDITICDVDDLVRVLHYIKEESIPKAVMEKKISWKPISEYNRKNYDWVLVKYFDGDYECVPEVAERRSDGKWYTSEKEIPFEVKYFFDIQEILNKGE